MSISTMNWLRNLWKRVAVDIGETTSTPTPAPPPPRPEHPVAFISDIHANLQALQAVMADIEAQGVREVICLGEA
jgi:hypothetical protein